MAVGDLGSRFFDERCLKDNDVLSLKNLRTCNLWLIYVRPHVSWTFTQPRFDSPELWEDTNGGWKGARTKGYCRRNIYNSSTDRRHLFILSRIINNLFTNVVSIDFIYIYCEKKNCCD